MCIAGIANSEPNPELWADEPEFLVPEQLIWVSSINCEDVPDHYKQPSSMELRYNVTMKSTRKPGGPTSPNWC